MFLKRIAFLLPAMLVLLLCAAAPGAFGALSETLDAAIAYPNPFQTRLGHTAVVFDNLTAEFRLRIYTVTGELVYDKTLTTGDGKFAWDVTNNDGERLAGGMYIYLLTGGGKKTGKIVVIR